MVLALGLVVIFLAVVAVYRGIDVRLALLGAALALGALGGQPMAIVRVFLATFSNERFVVPICTAMGFAYVLRYTGCDQHLVHLLIRPVQLVRPLLIPGTVAVGFLVNVPVVSQTSTAVTLGAVVIPILLAARLTPVTIGAALLLGASIGGELFNPGAPELRTIVEETEAAAQGLHKASPGLTTAEVVAQIAPLNFLGLAVATSVFWFLSIRAERRAQAGPPSDGSTVSESAAASTAPPSTGEQTFLPTTGSEANPGEFRVNPAKALIPLLPLLLLFLTAPPLRRVEIPPDWLLEAPKKTGRAARTGPASPPRTYEQLAPAERGLFDSRLIGAAMLVGVVVAALATWGKALGVAAAFFGGAGYGFTHIISLIVTANCLGEGVAAIGLADLFGELIRAAPWLLLPLAGSLPLGFAALCGSGMASTQSLFAFFAEPALQLGIDPALVGAVVSLASAAGRTMSPVAAVVLMCGTLTGTSPLDLARRVAIPLLAGMAAVIVAAIFMASG